MADPYLYPDSKVLVNKLGIKDADKLSAAENRATAVRMLELERNPVKGTFDYKHLQAVHQAIFKDVYEWAGKPRTIGIEKPEAVLGGRSVDYPHPNHPVPQERLDARAEYAFAQLKKDDFLKGLNKEQFVAKAVKHTAEIWEAHPFREGNTRAVMTFMRQVGKNAGYNLDTEKAQSHRGIRDALVQAADGNRGPLKEIFQQIVEPAKEKIMEKGQKSVTKDKPAIIAEGVEKFRQQYRAFLNEREKQVQNVNEKTATRTRDVSAEKKVQPLNRHKDREREL